jgi:cob(I)alamin adenosyltransferase
MRYGRRALAGGDGVRQDSRGYVHVYTGDGKGKTTAAIGLAVRAAGHDRCTYIGQFMKGQEYGELAALRHLQQITVEQYGDRGCIRKEEVTERHVAQAMAGLERARTAMLSGRYDVVVLDEVNVALWFGLLTVEAVMSLLDERPERVELVLTGRRAPQALLDRADLITEMREVRHYYSRGVTARKGIEF